MEIRQFIAIGLRWWWLIILVPAVAAVSGYFASPTEKPRYEATTTLMVGPSIFQGSDSVSLKSTDDLISSYRDMARRQPVLQGAADVLALDTDWQALKGRVRAQPVPGTQLLEITVTAASPAEAQVVANEIANQLILYSPGAQQEQERDEERRFVRQRMERLKEKIEAGQGRLDALEAELGEALSSGQIQQLQAEITALESSMTDWEANYAQLLSNLNSGGSASTLTIIETAQANSIPVQSRTYQYTLLAGVAGLCVALGLIYVLENLQGDKVKSADDLSRATGLITLGSVSRVQGRDYHDKLVAHRDPFSLASEAFRIVRSNLQFTSADRPVKSILVTSSIPAEGKSFTVANLGVVMAQAGFKTIIVDSDMRRPVQDQIFQLPNSGLTGFLRSPDSELDTHLQQTAVANLHVMTSGMLPGNPSELLGSKQMGQLITRLNELADVVIYDSPPVLLVTDALLLSNQVDGVVLVTRADKLSRDVIQRAIMSLQRAGADLLGGVLNQVSEKKGNYYYSYYYSHNGHRPASQPTASKLKRMRLKLPFF